MTEGLTPLLGWWRLTPPGSEPDRAPFYFPASGSFGFPELASVRTHQPRAGVSPRTGADGSDAAASVGNRERTTENGRSKGHRPRASVFGSLLSVVCCLFSVVCYLSNAAAALTR